MVQEFEFFLELVLQGLFSEMIGCEVQSVCKAWPSNSRYISKVIFHESYRVENIRGISYVNRELSNLFILRICFIHPSLLRLLIDSFQRDLIELFE